MGRTGGPKTQIALILLALAVIARLVVERVRMGERTHAGIVGIIVSAVVSLAIVALALTLQWRNARRER